MIAPALLRVTTQPTSALRRRGTGEKIGPLHRALSFYLFVSTPIPRLFCVVCVGVHRGGRNYGAATVSFCALADCVGASDCVGTRTGNYVGTGAGRGYGRCVGCSVGSSVDRCEGLGVGLVEGGAVGRGEGGA